MSRLANAELLAAPERWEPEEADRCCHGTLGPCGLCEREEYEWDRGAHPWEYER